MKLTMAVIPKYRLSGNFSGEMKKAGEATFELDGTTYTLSIFDEESTFLLPFRDKTNGKETYGGGRYIDIKIAQGKPIILDFNLAYNPNCAYGSDRFSCPIPPKENFLQLQIKAGEKSYKHSTAK